MFLSFNSPTTAPDTVLHVKLVKLSETCHSERLRWKTFCSVTRGQSEDDNKAFREELQKVRSENNILQARSKALEEERETVY